MFHLHPKNKFPILFKCKISSFLISWLHYFSIYYHTARTRGLSLWPIKAMLHSFIIHWITIFRIFRCTQKIISAGSIHNFQPCWGWVGMTFILIHFFVLLRTVFNHTSLHKSGWYFGWNSRPRSCVRWCQLSICLKILQL